MAKAIEAYRDDRGNLHYSPTSAVVADIAAALGRVGDEGGLTNGVAKLILYDNATVSLGVLVRQPFDDRARATDRNDG